MVHPKFEGSIPKQLPLHIVFKFFCSFGVAAASQLIMDKLRHHSVRLSEHLGLLTRNNLHPYIYKCFVKFADTKTFNPVQS